MIGFVGFALLFTWSTTRISDANDLTVESRIHTRSLKDELMKGVNAAVEDAEKVGGVASKDAAAVDVKVNKYKGNKPVGSTSKMSSRVVSVFENTQKLGAELAKNLSELANDVLNEGGNAVFKIGLSGGSTVTLLAECLPKIVTDWSKWRFFFCDERLVPFDNAESTYAQYRDKLIGLLPITEDQFIKINPQLSVNEAANDYIKKMSVYFAPYELPRFDALILGTGPDGHTCSLFPGHKLCEETSVWVAPISDSPKPPPNRITFTFPILNNARYCAFVATGSGKADILKRILKDNERLPANLVQPTNGSVQWLLDEPAAKLLQEETSL